MNMCCASNEHIPIRKVKHLNVNIVVAEGEPKKNMLK